MQPEDEELISTPVSRQDEMMRVAIPGFLGLFVVIMALAESCVTPDPIPDRRSDADLTAWSRCGSNSSDGL